MTRNEQIERARRRLARAKEIVLELEAELERVIATAKDEPVIYSRGDQVTTINAYTFPPGDRFA